MKNKTFEKFLTQRQCIIWGDRDLLIEQHGHFIMAGLYFELSWQGWKESSVQRTWIKSNRLIDTSDLYAAESPIESNHQKKPEKVFFSQRAWSAAISDFVRCA